MSPARFKPSVTVAAVVMRDGRFLIVEEHTPEGVRFNQPAGHLEQGESPLQACVREVLEETARVFTPTALLGLYVSRFQRAAEGGDEDITYVRFAFLGSVGEELAGRGYDAEIIRTHWLSEAELRARLSAHRSPLVMQCVADALAGQRFELSAVHTDPSVNGGAYL
jgi:phosphatase NudJ